MCATLTVLFLRTPVSVGAMLCVSMMIAVPFGFLPPMSPPIAPPCRDRGGPEYRTAHRRYYESVPVPTSSAASRVPALIIHGGAGADPGDGRAELRTGMRAA